jgi:hypothetical protein
MDDQRYNAMTCAVDLARSGKINNWWTIAARLRLKRYRDEDLDWTPTQRSWLDRLCTDAKVHPRAD